MVEYSYMYVSGTDNTMIKCTNVDSGDYSSSDSLLHYWRLGKDTSTDAATYKDYGNHTTLIDFNSADNITTADVVDDYPGA